MRCETVSTSFDSNFDLLARVSIVNVTGDVIYDKFVRPVRKVMNYRTNITGIRPGDLDNGENYHTVRLQVKNIIKWSILVGHEVQKDLFILRLNHRPFYIRDTSTYWRFMKFTKGRIPNLKLLVARFLDKSLMEGEHNSIKYARASLKLYLSLQKYWDIYMEKELSKTLMLNKMNIKTINKTSSGKIIPDEQNE